MQKKLIALAVAGLASTAAFAQSNVTIYGVADATFDIVKTSDSVEPSHNRISTNSSYLGFKGAEDLGNGLKAVFQFEGGIGFDGGNTTAWSTGRDSFVGLSGGFGTIVAGNLTGPTRALGAAVDVNAGATGIGANSGIIGKFGGLLQNATLNANGDVTLPLVSGRSATNASTFDTRFKNAIAYVSPNFSGFSFVAAYVANENKVDNGINTWGYDLGAKYENGPVMVGLTFNEVKDASAQDINVSDIRLAGSYNFGVASVRALFERVKVKLPGVSAEHQNTWGLGGTFNVTPAGKIIAQYYRANDISGAGNEESGATLWELGYEHSLSKRTIVKAVYANLNNKDNAFYQFGVNSGAANVGATQSGFQFGVRHSF